MNWCNTNRETKLNRNDCCCCHHRKNETIFHVNKWIVWLLPKSLTQPSHLSFFFILTWREKRRNEVGWPREKGKFFLLFFKIIFGGRYWNVRKLSALPVVDEAVFWCTHTHPRLLPPSVQYVWTWNPFFSFFGRKTNLLFLCWLWENVLVFLTFVGKKGKEKATALGHQFPLSQSRKWSLCCCFWFFHEFGVAHKRGCHAPWWMSSCFSRRLSYRFSL